MGGRWNGQAMGGLWRGSGMVMVLLGAASDGAKAQSFVQDVLGERLMTTVDSLMRVPFDPLSYTMHAHQMGFLDTADSSDMQQMLYEMTLATNTGTGGMDMVYAGLEDGRFLGYFSPESYTYGADTASDPFLKWAPYTLDAIDATCADAKSCSNGISMSQVDCEAADCSGTACVWAYHPCRKEAGLTLAASCPAADRDGSCHSADTDTSGLDAAACATVPHSFWYDPCTLDLCIGTADDQRDCATAFDAVRDLSKRDNSASCPAGCDYVPRCCDGALRNYYATAISARGQATAFRRWRLYDPRMRPWYRQAISSWHNEGQSTGWSSVYVFTTSRQLGLTAMLTAYGASGSPEGVFAVDYELATISATIKNSLAGSPDAFAYVVEIGEGASKYGLTRGLMIGCSTEEPIMVEASSVDRIGACSDGISAGRDACEEADCDGHPCVWASCTESQCRLRATGSRHPAVAASAAVLERRGWPANEFVSEGSPGIGWEVYTQEYTGEHGLSWLVVSGITRNCEPCDMWHSYNGACERCVPVPGLIECPCCSPGTYNYNAGGSSSSCVSCDSMAIPMVKPPLSPITPEAMLLPEACPGGLPGVAVVLPYAGLWVHALADGTPELLACENADACAQANASAWPAGAFSRDGSVCAVGYQGFMCRECIDGYAKVARFCVECESFNALTIIFTVLSNFVVAFALLHVSTIAVVSSDEFKQIWYKVDLHRTGFLDQDGVIAVLELLGVGDVDTVAKDLMDGIGRDPPFFNSKRQERVKGRDSLNSDTADESEFYGKGKDRTHAYHQSEHTIDGSIDAGSATAQPQKLVSVLDFVEERKKQAPTQLVATTVFFVQTLGLVAKDASWFGILDALNLDVESSAGACVSPLPTTDRFIQYIFVTPTVLALSVYIACPLWRCLRLHCCLAKVVCKKNPLKITAVHRQRALLNVYMFAFFPMVKAAVAVLVCIDTSSEPSEEAPLVLAMDYSISCFSQQWWLAAGFAFVTLLVMVVLVPIYLIRKARDSVHLRQVNMQLQVLAIDDTYEKFDSDQSNDLDQNELGKLLDELGYGSSARERVEQEFKDLPRDLFEAMDEDGSNTLDKFEVVELLKAMGREMDDLQVEEAFVEMDTDRGGDVDLKEFLSWFETYRRKQASTAGTDEPIGVTRGELHAWFRQRIKNSVQTPFDILYGTTTEHAYWWWALLLWLKVFINLLFSWGTVSISNGVSWHVWMHIGLAVFVCISVNTRPYKNPVDFKVELAAILTLNLVTHIASIYKTGENWDPGSVLLATSLAAIPILALIMLKVRERLDDKKTKNERLNRWRQPRKQEKEKEKEKEKERP